jgi:predicted nucleic acid-binding protein
MTVPGRVESARLLCSLAPPSWFLRHSRAVAEVAAWLARRIALRGLPIDRRAVEAAALLHDVDKLLPADDPARRLRHGEGSAAWLAAHGHAELGPLVANHPVTRLAEEDPVAVGRPLEALVVAYADKRAGQRLESLDERFASWRRRYPDGPSSGGWDDATSRHVRARADALERRVCELAGVRASEVRRLAWTGRALRVATMTAVTTR